MTEAVTKNEFYFPSTNGVNQVHCIEWLPADETPRAVVQLAHGVAEYVDRYDDFARFLASNGYVVVGNDHLGHGLTAADESELVWFGAEESWMTVVADMKALRDLYGAKHPALPYYLLGHSMGSFLSRSFIIRYPDALDGVMLSGTGQHDGITCLAGKTLAQREIRRHGSKYRSAALQKLAFGSYLKKIENPTGPNDWLTRDAALVAAYDADPLCGGTATAGLMRDMMAGLDFIRRPANLEKMKKTMPVLFFSGADDPVGGWSKGVKQAAASFLKAGMKDVTLRLYDGGRHEILNETNKQEVYADVLGWLNERVLRKS